MNSTKCCWNKKMVLLGVLPGVLIYLTLNAIPSLLTFVYSFTDIKRTGGDWHFIGLENYRQLLWQQNARDTWEAVWNTLKFAVIVTIVQNVFALLMAVLFNGKSLRGRSLYRSVVFLPFVLGVTVCSYTWVLMTGIDGPVMTLLNSFGVNSGLLASSRDAFTVVMFIQIWMTAGYAMVLDIAGLQGIPVELYEAAGIDGANSVRCFFKITIPLLWPTISINVLLSVIGGLGTVQTILLTTGGGYNTETLAMRIYRNAFSIGNINSGFSNLTQGYAAAESMLLFVIVLFFTLIVNGLQKRREKEYEI